MKTPFERLLGALAFNSVPILASYLCSPGHMHSLDPGFSVPVLLPLRSCQFFSSIENKILECMNFWFGNIRGWVSKHGNARIFCNFGHVKCLWPGSQRFEWCCPSFRDFGWISPLWIWESAIFYEWDLEYSFDYGVVLLDSLFAHMYLQVQSLAFEMLEWRGIAIRDISMILCSLMSAMILS